MRSVNLRFVMLTVMVLVMVSGCSGQEETYTIGEAGSWKDGVYTEYAEGRNGSFKVEVTVENGYMTSISADGNRETPERGGRAISVMIPTMLAGQSYDVDIISGATITSKALRKAVGEALEEAALQDC